MKYIKFFPKWKIVIFVLFIISVPGCLFSHNPYGLDNAIFSAIMCLLIAVCPLLPDIVYLKTSKEELWSVGILWKVNRLKHERKEQHMVN